MIKWLNCCGEADHLLFCIQYSLTQYLILTTHYSISGQHKMMGIQFCFQKVPFSGIELSVQVQNTMYHLHADRVYDKLDIDQWVVNIDFLSTINIQNSIDIIQLAWLLPAFDQQNVLQYTRLIKLFTPPENFRKGILANHQIQFLPLHHKK